MIVKTHDFFLYFNILFVKVFNFAEENIKPIIGVATDLAGLSTLAS